MERREKRIRGWAGGATFVYMVHYETCDTSVTRMSNLNSERRKSMTNGGNIAPREVSSKEEERGEERGTKRSQRARIGCDR